MKRYSLVLLFFYTLLAHMGAFASPEDDRTHLIDLYKGRFHNIELQDYVYGALIFSKDAKAQYDEIMVLPAWGDVLANGETMWKTPFKNGKTYASCFPNGGRNVAGKYPYYDEALGKVVTFEMALNMCRTTNGEEPYKYDDMDKMGVLDTYAKSLSDGMRMDIKVESPGALAAYDRGKSLFFARKGQLNFACATCHVENAGKHVRNEFLSPAVGQATHWPLFRGDSLQPWTLQKRYAACNGLTRLVPFKIGSEEYNDLEYFHSYISNGLPLHAAVWRK